MRVAITTDRFDTVAAAYEAVGLNAVELPCLRVGPAEADVLDAARADVARADLAVITSARTVVLLWPERAMPAVDVAVVGSATAAAVSEHGGRVVVTGDAGLAELVGAIPEQRGHVVFPHARGSDRTTISALRNRCPRLVEYEVYGTIPIAPALTEVDAVTFASPSAVEGWHLSRNLHGLVVGAIGATTGAAVARRRPPDVVASQPLHSALAQAMASHLEVSP